MTLLSRGRAAQIKMDGSAETHDWRQFQVLAPLRGAFSGFDLNQGFRSLHSLNPGYCPCTPPACEEAARKG